MADTRFSSWGPQVSRVCGHTTPTSASICTRLLPCVALGFQSPPPFSSKDTCHWILGSTLIQDDLIQRSVPYICKDLLLNKVTRRFQEPHDARHEMARESTAGLGAGGLFKRLEASKKQGSKRGCFKETARTRALRHRDRMGKTQRCAGVGHTSGEPGA